MNRPSLVLALFAAGCGGSEAARCVEGASLACACADGRAGAQLCDSRGVLGPCSCEVGREAGAPSADAAVDAAPVVSHAVDLLFMIDNSPTMIAKRNVAPALFNVLLSALEKAPSGRPDLHVGVITSDLGAGSRPLANGGCQRFGGDRGLLQAKAGCGLEGGALFLSSGRDGHNNFTGGIEEAFSCLSNVGSAGCGYEHQLQSVRVALDGKLAPENKDFLRDEAVLGIVLVTDEDDCSAPVDTNLFIDDAAFPMTTGSFRCAKEGHLCNGMSPPVAPFDAPLESCQANPGGRLVKVKEIVDSIRALKRRPDEQILVAGIFGWAVMPAGAHYQYVLTRPGLDLAPVCNSMAAGSGGEGYPGLRLKAFVESFGASGTFASICEDAIGPGLMGFAQKLASRL